MIETGQGSPALAPSNKRSPTEAGAGDAHASKAARVEGAPPQGFIPQPSIAEGTEPDT
jgi:hypothetical protein